jgi:hypothetical protein
MSYHMVASFAGSLLKEKHGLGYADALTADLAVQPSAWLVTADPKFARVAKALTVYLLRSTKNTAEVLRHMPRSRFLRFAPFVVIMDDKWQAPCGRYYVNWGASGLLAVPSPAIAICGRRFAKDSLTPCWKN